MKVLLLLVALALLAPLTGEACTVVNAYLYQTGFGPCSIVEGDYIQIGTQREQQLNTNQCGLNGTYNTWYVVSTYTCGGTTECQDSRMYIAGSNLSGTYRVQTMNGYCVELCACTP